MRRALVGGNVAAAAQRNGWAGLVIDGAVRDVAELAATEIGIRALAHVPIPTEKKNQGERDVPVQVMGLWVRPGRPALRRRRRHRPPQDGLTTSSSRSRPPVSIETSAAARTLGFA